MRGLRQKIYYIFEIIYKNIINMLIILHILKYLQSLTVIFMNIFNVRELLKETYIKNDWGEYILAWIYLMLVFVPIFDCIKILPKEGQR